MLAWEVNAKFIETKFQGDGDGFARLIADILRAKARLAGLGLGAVEYIEKNQADGGIDLASQETSSMYPEFSVPGIWQCKAERSQGQKKYREEITGQSKTEVRKRIKAGDAYYFCLCHEVATWAKIQQSLTEEVKNINPRAPNATVWTPSRIAQELNQFPALVAKYRHGDADSFLHVEDQVKNLARFVPKYVEVDLWSEKQSTLNNFLSPQHKGENIISVSGDAGVGKSRFVLETILRLGLQGSTLYTNYESIGSLSHIPKSADNLVLVLDECPIVERAAIQDRFGCRDDWRIITIDNQKISASRDGYQFWLEKISEESQRKILELNFLAKGQDLISLALEVSQGFMRIAQDICNNGLETGKRNAQGYYESRVFKENRKALEALSLVLKVGYRDQVANELKALADCCELEVSQIREAAKAMKNAPGFIAEGGRYYYITPLIIAEIAFRNAWERWIEHDPESFFKKIVNANLFQPFLKRLEKVGTEKMRGIVATFVKEYAEALKPEDLGKSAFFLIELVKAIPDDFLTILRRLIENADSQTISQLDLPISAGKSWRREIVWVMEKFAHFNEYFEDAEAILYRLAMQETETYGNNATGIWLSLFSLFSLSTAQPYPLRFQILQDRLQDAEQEEISLLLKGLSYGFKQETHQIVPPAIIAGKLTPQGWRPATWGDVRKEARKTFNAFKDLIQGNKHDCKTEAIQLVSKSFNNLLIWGMRDEIQTLFQLDGVGESIYLPLIETIDSVLRLDLKGDHETKQELEAWREELIKSCDLRTRLKLDFSWRNSANLEDRKGLAAEVAEKLFNNPKEFERELPWLCSPDAPAADELGFAYGKLDTEGKWLEIILQHAKAGFGFASSYLSVQLKEHPGRHEKIQKILDEIEAINPINVFFLLEYQKPSWAYDWIVRLYQEDKISLEHYYSFARRRFSDINQALATLFHLKEIYETAHDILALHVALDLLGMVVFHLPDEEQPFLTKRDWENLLPLLRIIVYSEDKVSSYHFGDILAKLAQDFPTEAIQFGFNLIVQDRYDNELKDFLAKESKNNSAIVLRNLGTIIDKQEKDYYLLHFNSLWYLLKELDEEVLFAWLDENNKRASRLAYSLPWPRLDENGFPKVEDITLKWLERYKDQEEIENEFCMGPNIGAVHFVSDEYYLNEIRRYQAFLEHPNKIIRTWAKQKLESTKRERDWHANEEAERRIH